MTVCATWIARCRKSFRCGCSRRPSRPDAGFRPRSISAVDTIDVEIGFLKDAPALKHRAAVHFHAFTSETMATVSLYGYEAVQPGSVRLARLKLSEPIVLVPGDHFVLRQPSPAGTIGGGRVLDAHPEPRLRKADNTMLAGAIEGWFCRRNKSSCGLAGAKRTGFP